MALVVRDLFVYPIKGCRGIRVERARIAARGFAGDRRWMVVDAGGTFVSQRSEASLAHVSVALVGEDMHLSAPGQPAAVLPAAHDSGARRAVQVWDDQVQAIEHDEGSAWFSRLLGRPHALVYMPEEERRPVGESDPGAVVSFADGYPFLVVTTASLDDLNGRLDSPVGIERFRPNIVLSGGAPFAEDSWRRLEVGPVGFRAAKPCGRCLVINVDPATAARGSEPLRTLARFRTRDGSALFGMNLVHEASGGTIAVGDAAQAFE